MKKYLYSISRRDIPLAQQSIQGCHAAIEHAYLYGRPENSHAPFIHLTTQNKAALLELQATLATNGIPTAEFHEPYKDWGLTAIACLLGEEQRCLLQKLQLWTTQNAQVQSIIPASSKEQS